MVSFRILLTQKKTYIRAQLLVSLVYASILYFTFTMVRAYIHFYFSLVLQVDSTLPQPFPTLIITRPRP